MLNGLPFLLCEKRRHGNGDVAYHKYGEGEGVKYLFKGGAMYLFPLRNYRDSTQNEQEGVHTANGHGEGYKKGQNIFTHYSKGNSSRKVDHYRKDAQNESGENGTGHIEAGRTLF